MATDWQQLLNTAHAGGKNRWFRKSAGFDTFMESGFDEQGFPIGVPLVRHEDAFTMQSLSERSVAERNARMRREAIATLEGGLGVMESFRPGGASGLAAGLYSQKANLMFQDQVQAPDLMADFRRHRAHEERSRVKKAQQFGAIGGGLQALGLATSLIPGAGPFIGAGLALPGSSLSRWRWPRSGPYPDREPDCAYAVADYWSGTAAGPRTRPGADLPTDRATA